MSFVDILPPELTEVIFSHLSLPDLVNASMVCVSWYEASNTSRIWRAAIKRSTPKDRFKILSDLERFTGIASNYNDNHCFQVDRQSPSDLSPINPWKLSLCQNNFVRGNWFSSDTTALAVHQVEVEDSLAIMGNMNLLYPSKSPQDRLYLPILVGRILQPADLLLVRLDGKPRIIRKIMSTKKEIPIACIDRDCLVWVQHRMVWYLSLVENNSQIENLGMLFPESFMQFWKIDMKLYYMMTMNDKYIVVGFQQSVVKIWCKKTKQLLLTHEAEQTILNVKCTIYSFNLYNERVYFKHCSSLSSERCFIEIYDIEKAKFVEKPFSTLNFYSIAFSDKYYAMFGALEDHSEINVHDIDTNELKISVLVNIPRDFVDHTKVWFVDDEVIYIEEDRLKILSLVDWKIRNGIPLPTIPNDLCVYDICNTFLLAKGRNELIIWDWKLERRLGHELFFFPVCHFSVDETRLVAVGTKYVQVVGFW